DKASGCLTDIMACDDQSASRWTLPPRFTQPVAVAAQAEQASQTRDCPAWLFTDAPPVITREEPLAPSSLIDAADREERSRDTPRIMAARARGRLAHALLEHLPQTERTLWPALTGRIAARMGIGPAMRDAIVSGVQAVLAQPGLAPLFGPDSRAEVAITGKIDREGRAPLRISGVIDRLAMTEDAIWIADYKTGRLPPRNPADIPEAIVAQLALYRAAVSPLAPDRPVRCLVIWTAGPLVQEVPGPALDAALSRVTAL
ncbi:MAG: PD-(D/E)XK nuclease family protein, partial [Beijerinckiaceae bacterium]